MKKAIIALIMTMSFVQVFGQDKNDTLKIIEQKVGEINQDTNYWISTFTNEAFLDTGFINQPGQGYGQLTGFFKHGKVCKIRELIGISLLQEVAITEYYFVDGKLIYVYEQEKQGPDIFIDSEGTIDHRIDEPTFEVRYYFDDDKLIGLVEKGVRTTILLPNEDFFDSQSKEGQLLHSAQKYHALFSIKYKQ